MQCSSHLALHCDPAEQRKACIWAQGTQLQVAIRCPLSRANAVTLLLAEAAASPTAAWCCVQEDSGSLGGSHPTASSGEWQQQKGCVEGWGWGWSELGLTAGASLAQQSPVECAA